MLVDDLAAQLQKIVSSLNGYSGCATIRAQVADAREVLARYYAEKAEQACQEGRDGDPSTPAPPPPQ